MGLDIESSPASQWWKWLLMPFAAFLGAGIGAFLVTKIQWFMMKLHGGYSEEGWFYLYVLPIITSATFGALFAFITCRIAPRGKLIAGVVMTTILAIFMLIALLMIWLNPEYTLGDAIQVTAGTIATVIACIVVLMQVHSDPYF